MISQFSQELFITFTPQEKSKYQQIHKAITSSNLQLFNIPESSQEKKNYPSAKPIKVSMKGGWYVHLTDNQIQTNDCVLAFHGAPGNHLQWASISNQLMKMRKCRWINFICPGFDDEDERRGTFKGTSKQINEIINHILTERKVKQVVICAQSYGNFVGLNYMMNNRERVRGWINICGILNHWQIGHLGFHQNILVNSKIGEIPPEKLYQTLNNDHQRKHHFQLYKSHKIQRNFNEINPFQLKITQLCSIVKLYQDVGTYEKLILFYRSLNMLKVFALGQNDPYNDNANFGYNFQHATNEFYSRNKKTLENPSFIKELKSVILKKYGFEMEPTKLQQYFCYAFPKTGHNVERRRGEEIAKIMDAYLTVLPVFQSHAQLSKSKL